MPDKEQEAVIRFYDSWASYYDEPDFLLAYEKSLTVKLAMRGGDSILEIGSGTGRITTELLTAGKSVLAVEPSVRMRERLGEKCRHFINNGSLRVIAGTMQEFTPDSKQYDVLLLPMVVDHIRRLEDVFSLGQRILAKDGRIVISCVNPYYQRIVRKGRVCQGAQRNAEIERVDSGDEIAAHSHLFSDLVAAAKQAEFRLDELLEAVIDDSMIHRFPELARQNHFAISYAASFVRAGYRESI